MKISDHTIYASTKIDRHNKTSALSVPSVVDIYQYGYRVNIYSGSESAWTLDKETKFVYNGWNLIQEVEASVYDSNNSAFTQFRTSNYTWGLDLSQTLQGAGGVGGLLSLDKGTATYYYTYDANGNVSELIDTAGNIAAHYEYSPFGKLTKEFNNPQFTISNPFRFSTKYLDNETQLYYYGLRYYNPENGRWINRDPIEENGGENLYGFVQSNVLNEYDYVGLVRKSKTVISDLSVTCRCGDVPVNVTLSVSFGFGLAWKLPALSWTGSISQRVTCDLSNLTGDGQMTVHFRATASWSEKTVTYPGVNAQMSPITITRVVKSNYKLDVGVHMATDTSGNCKSKSCSK